MITQGRIEAGGGTGPERVMEPRQVRAGLKILRLTQQPKDRKRRPAPVRSKRRAARGTKLLEPLCLAWPSDCRSLEHREAAPRRRVAFAAVGAHPLARWMNA